MVEGGVAKQRWKGAQGRPASSDRSTACRTLPGTDRLGAWTAHSSRALAARWGTLPCKSSSPKSPKHAEQASAWRPLAVKKSEAAATGREVLCAHTRRAHKCEGRHITSQVFRDKNNQFFRGKVDPKIGQVGVPASSLPTPQKTQRAFGQQRRSENTNNHNPPWKIPTQRQHKKQERSLLGDDKTTLLAAAGPTAPTTAAPPPTQQRQCVCIWHTSNTTPHHTRAPCVSAVLCGRWEPDHPPPLQPACCPNAEQDELGFIRTVISHTAAPSTSRNEGRGGVSPVPTTLWLAGGCW